MNDEEILKMLEELSDYAEQNDSSCGLPMGARACEEDMIKIVRRRLPASNAEIKRVPGQLIV
jgi:hypothetical protein